MCDGATQRQITATWTARVPTIARREMQVASCKSAHDGCHVPRPLGVAGSDLDIPPTSLPIAPPPPRPPSLTSHSNAILHCFALSHNNNQPPSTTPANDAPPASPCCLRDAAPQTLPPRIATAPPPGLLHTTPPLLSKHCLSRADCLDTGPTRHQGDQTTRRQPSPLGVYDSTKHHCGGRPSLDCLATAQ